jgi:predicted MFS family arabinose efflux permease
MASSHEQQPLTTRQLTIQLILFLAVRTFFNTAFRMIYPFQQDIAAGVGVSLQSLQQAIAARNFLGVFSPIFGAIGDSRGRKFAMVGGIVLFAISVILVVLIPTFPVLVISLFLTSVAKFTFDPALYAYLSDRIPYERRGLAIGVIEFGWSGAFLLGVPFASFLIVRAGWISPFVALSIIAVASVVLLWNLLPSDHSRAASNRVSMRQGFMTVIRSRSAVGALFVAAVIMLSNELVNINFSSWMRQSFGWDTTELAVTATVIGIAELIAEIAVAGLIDRLGKRRAVAIGFVLYALSSFLIPALGITPNGALVALFFFYFAFEFTLVCSLPLMTEIVPAARATFMATMAAFHSIGRVIGTLWGPALFVDNILMVSLWAGALNIVALVVLLILVREAKTSSIPSTD